MSDCRICDLEIAEDHADQRFCRDCYEIMARTASARVDE